MPNLNDASWYDTNDGLEDAIRRGLPGLDDIINARHEAGYIRREQLSEWIIGHFWFDSSGNVWTTDRPIAHSYEVVSAAEAKRDRHLDGCSSSLRRIASSTDRCFRCKQFWDLKNASDVAEWQGNVVHRECRRYIVQDELTTAFSSVLFDLGLSPNSLSMVPNRYGPSDSYGPWFMFDSPIGPIIIGWRKRVINIEWTGDPDGKKLFSAEGVTTDHNLVHAWNYEKATEYLRAILRSSSAIS